MFDSRNNTGANEIVGIFPTFLIVGLGNPGHLYHETRHNIGFKVLDVLATELGGKFSKVQTKAIIGIIKQENRRVVLAKPQTYMNLSGKAVANLVRFYKIPITQIIVVHDDVDLPFGNLRIRPGGGAGGQKGVKSIIENLGTKDFPRMRMGIGRPPGHLETADYVLQTFSKSEQEILIEEVNRAISALKCFLDQGLEAAMNQFNPVP